MLLRNLFELVICSGSTVFDVGAYQGELTSFFASLVGKDGRVCSFEPHPAHFLKLAVRADSEPYRNVSPFCRALSDRTGHQTLYLAPEETSQSSSILPELGSTGRLGDGVQRCLVETDTIDNFSRNHGVVPHFIKIDAEGAERLVLAGARRVFESVFPTLVFEGVFGFDEAQQAYPFKEAVPSHVAWLESLGYRIFLIDIDYIVSGWVREGSRLYASNYGLLSLVAEDFARLPLIGCNLLAVHESRQETLEVLSRSITGGALQFLASLSVPLHQ